MAAKQPKPRLPRKIPASSGPRQPKPAPSSPRALFHPRPLSPAPGAAPRFRSPPKTKLDALIAALAAPKGASLERLMAVTGWQAHSVRGAISGALKTKRGLAIASTKQNGVRLYRIIGKS